MKTAALIILLLMPVAIFAQNYQGMNEKDMQQMMQQMQKMQSCMQNIDQEEMKVLEERSNQLEAEIKSLCASGKRDEAQAKAISFGKEFANDPTVQTMRKCGALMEGMVPEMPYMEQDKDHSSRHVCD